MNAAWQRFSVSFVSLTVLILSAVSPSLAFADSDPAIVVQPKNQTALAGSNATFTATATGTDPLYYQWYFNGHPIAEGGRASGTTTPALTIQEVSSIDAANYTLVVNNLNGMATSSVATLTIGTVRFVNVASLNSIAPYTNWLTAATTIQDAINVSGLGDLILVTNGTYASGEVSTGNPNYATHRIALNKPLTVMSLNGPGVTTIVGQGAPFGSFGRRVAYLTNGAFLAGFTLTGGEADLGDTSDANQSGGAVLCQSGNCIVSNCVISSSVAGRYGGGVYSGTLINCVISGNNARDIQGGRIGEGGGAYSSTLINCVVANNSARYEGGGVMMGALTNCLVMNNTAVWGGGNAYASTVNCTVAKNSAYDDGGLGGGGVGGVLDGTVYNSIVVENTGPYGNPNFSSYTPSMSYSCTFPDPGGGTSNIVVADPLFVDSTNNNFHLQTNSPCVNAGTNLPSLNTDLDGAPRIVDGIIDMGAYELQKVTFINGDPQSQTVVATSNAVFRASAIGDEPLIYQWFFNGTPLTNGGRIFGATSNLLTIAGAQTNDAGKYWLVVSNSFNAATSSVSTLTVLLPVTISSQPTNKIVATGTLVSFTAAATGLSTLSYAWYSNDIVLANGGRFSGADTATLTISNTQTNDTATYYVVISDSYGSLTSSNATLTVLAPVQIVGQPASQAVSLGSDATFAVTALGSEPIGYHWFFNGTSLSDNTHISGSTTPALTISNIQSSDAGGYVVIASNQLNSATSHLAALTLITAGATSTRFVNLSNTTPLAPYLTWSNAATNIQDAVDASVAGDLILVSNGIYKTGTRTVYGATNRVAVDKAVMLQSVNGPDSTIIFGNSVGASVISGRCVYLTNGASLTGFTLMDGNAVATGPVDTNHVLNGGGVWCESSSVVVSNCILSGNFATRYGGGAFQGTLLNCVLTNNNANFGGGAASNVLVNCTLIKNRGTFQNFTSGGGAIYSTLSNCLLVANSCNGGGGGAGFSTLTSCVLSNNNGNNGGALIGGTATDCLISSNKAFTAGGGACSNVLNNCILKNNATSSGNGGGAYYSFLANCTVVSNSTPIGSGAGGGLYGGAATNCIVYYNFSLKETNFLGSILMDHCCTPNLATNGFGNITNEPVFADLVNGDYHLLATSPCINSGNNFDVTTTNDIDGNPRIVGGTVDIGAYEFQAPASALSYAWAVQHGLPTDGSVDGLDSDGDGFSNWQEWLAGTDPNDASSKLAMLPAPGTNSVGITITWQSSLGVPYFVQRCTNFAMFPAFQTIQSNIIGQAGTTSYSDTNVPIGMPSMYRVGVQH